MKERRIERARFVPKLGWFTFTSATFPFSLWLAEGETWAPLAPIDLAGAALVPLPADWRTPETARHAFRQTWCAREGVEIAVCDHPESADRPRPAHVDLHRRAWCDRAGGADAAPERYAGAACDDFFADLDRRFEAAWTEERETAVATRDRPSLEGLDLRSANAGAVSLVGADLRGARLEGADLFGARLEGANLSGARLEGADLFRARLEGADLFRARLEGADLGRARLEGADLFGARLEGANLSGARLEGANLGRARLEGADLFGARLEGADLGRARLEGADLFGARLEGANLSGARLEGADLGRARLEGADLFGARLEGANLRYADFRNANWAGASNRASPAQFGDFRGGQGLTQAQLDQLIGNAETLLPDGPSDTGGPWYIWSCWELQLPPPDLEAIIATVAGPFVGDGNLAALRAEFLCSPGNPRRETGTPCALELTREQCLDPAQNPHHPENRRR